MIFWRTATGWPPAPATEQDKCAPSRRYLERYCAATGRAGIPEWPVFLAFACFRSAAIIQGVAARTAMGNVSTGSVGVEEHGAKATGRSGGVCFVDPLSPRETEILVLLAQRLSNREIGERLAISPVTVKRHANNIYSKLGVHDRRDAVAKASGLGLC